MFKMVNWKSVSFTLGLSLVLLFCGQISHAKGSPIGVSHHHEAPYEKPSAGCILGSCEVPLSKENLQLNLSMSFFPNSNLFKTFHETCSLFNPHNLLFSCQEITDYFEGSIDLHKFFSVYLI